MVSKFQIMKKYKERLIDLSEDEVETYIDSLTKDYVLAMYTEDKDKVKGVVYSLNELRFIFRNSETYPEIESFINYSIAKNLGIVLGYKAKIYVPEAIELLSVKKSEEEIAKERELKGLKTLQEAFSDERTLRLEKENKEFKAKIEEIEHENKQLKIMLEGI